MRARFEATFRSLRVRNYRLFFLGQIVSVSGTWMQIVALGWLVLDLSDGSALAVGVVTALQQVPMLLLGAWGGVIADRFSKRRILVVTQAVSAGTSLALGVLAITGHATLVNVGALALLTGCATVVDLPTRQVFLSELVDTDDLINAVGLNSAVFNGARIVGPAGAGVLLLTVGAGWCFVLNGVSFLAVIVALLAMRPDELRRSPLVARAKGQVRAGLVYIVRTPELRANLVLMTVVGTLSINFPVVLPLLAKETFGGDAGTYSLFTVAMGLGALVGALQAAGRRAVNERLLVRAAIGFGVMSCVAAVAPNLGGLLPILVVMGAVNITLFATSNTLLQLRSDPAMRGRVLAVRGVTVLGTTPIGAPATGWICDTFGPRWGLAVGGFAGLAAAAWLWSSARTRPDDLDLRRDPALAT